MSVIYSTYCPFPPATNQVGIDPSGTISNISCNGPCQATIYSAAGTVLMAINISEAFSMPVSLAYSGGVPTITQQTASSINVTI
jgi:hypothetical protein